MSFSNSALKNSQRDPPPTGSHHFGARSDTLGRRSTPLNSGAKDFRSRCSEAAAHRCVLTNPYDLILTRVEKGRNPPFFIQTTTTDLVLLHHKRSFSTSCFTISRTNYQNQPFGAPAATLSFGAAPNPGASVRALIRFQLTTTRNTSPQKQS